MNKDTLFSNLDKIHTTPMGVERIKRNLALNTDDVAQWCKNNIKNKHSIIEQKGKNWYVEIDDYILTILTALAILSLCIRTPLSLLLIHYILGILQHGHLPSLLLAYKHK